MNRELKFRVWDKLAQRMIYPNKGYQGHYVLDLNGRFHNLQNGSGGDDYVVMEYTGLTDSQGNPICEGDFIRGQFDHGPAGLRQEILPVRWSNEDGYQWNYWDLSTIQVIGNVFENSDLLK